MLIVLGGLPGVGKTTIARELARTLGAVHVRIDAIEHALRASGLVVEDEGYNVVYAVAEDDLQGSLHGQLPICFTIAAALSTCPASFVIAAATIGTNDRASSIWSCSMPSRIPGSVLTPYPV